MKNRFAILAIGLCIVAVMAPPARGAESPPAPGQSQDPVGPAYLEVRDVPPGTLHRLAYKSSALGTDREVVVYTPPITTGLRSGIPCCTCCTARGATRPAGPSVDRPMSSWTT